MATDAEGKKLSDLRVVDLRAELEKRGLDKTGVKAALLERLQKALLSEGKDPDEYEFELNDKKPVKRLSTSNRTEEVDNSAETSANDSNVLMIETPSLEQEADKDVQTHEEESKKKSHVDNKNDIANAESPLNISIGDEEELLNSGDEHDQSANSLQKDEDEKTAANQSNVDDTKKSDSSTVKPDDDKEDEQNDSTHNVDSSADNHEDDDKMDDNGGSEDTKKDDVVDNSDAAATTTTTATSSSSSATATTTAPSASSNGATVASDKESSKSDKDAEKDKDKDKNNKGNPGRSLWVTNLLPSTRAQELKHLLSKYGKVIGAKVVQSSRYPRQRCYGYVTMETRAAADLCIEKLTNTELKGQIIRVAKVRPEHSLPIPMNKTPKKEDSVEKDKRKKSPPKSSTKSDRKSPEKKKETTAATAAAPTTPGATDTTEKKKDATAKKDGKDGKEERDRSRKSSRESTGRKRSLTKSATRVERKSDILTFDKIREERERQRQRERERAMREEEKRRREIARSREIEKRQREEAMRLEREREKLRMEQDRLDRQRAEIMRLVRERQRLEREKLEQERQELRRAQLKLEEVRRPVKRPSSSTTANYRRESGGAYTDERKRMVTDRHYDETPPPPRFEVANRDSAPDIPKSKELPKDYKSRLAYSSKRAEEYPPKRSSGSEFKRDYPPAERHSGGHPSHLVHSIGNSASSSKYESSSYVNREREREIREPMRRDTIVPNVPPPRISKDARYAERTGERSPVSYRAVRDERERRQVSDHHSSKAEIRSSRDHRYPEPTMKEGARYREGGNSWHSTPVKPFSNIGGGGSAASSRDSWNKTDTWRPMEANTNERWGNSSSRMLMSGTSGVPNSIFSGGSSTLGISAGLSCPPPPGNSSYPMDRFESSFKSLNSSRKY